MKGDGIVYSDLRQIDGAQLRDLFASVGWDSAHYAEEHLERAMLGSDAVCMAWEGERLVGMINALSDGCLTVYIHYSLVRPELQGEGWAGNSWAVCWPNMPNTRSKS